MKSFEEVTHAEMVSILAKSGADIAAELVARPNITHLLHMVTCLIEESQELISSVSKENTLEELGDLLFYWRGAMQGLHNETSLPTQDLDAYEFRALNEEEAHNEAVVATLSRSLRNHAIGLFSVLKPVFMYGESIHDRAKGSYENTYLDNAYVKVANVGYTIIKCAHFAGYKLADLEKHNKQKLSKRYKRLMYSNEQATTRADKKEGEV